MHGRTVQWLACMLAAAVVFGACGLASAQDAILMDPGYAMAASQTGATATNKLVSTSSYINELEARVAALETALDDDGDSGWEDVSGEKWSHKVGGRAMFDVGMFTHQDTESEAVLGNLQNYVELRRLRLFVQGEGYGVYDYKLQLDFDDAESNMKDVYVGIHEIPLLGYVRAGHFKEPFSLEELTSSKYITFMERALPNALVRGRSVGVCAYNHSEDEQFTIASGAFIADIDEEDKEAVDDELGVDLATRVTWNPWYTAEGRGVLHVGVGGNFQDHRGVAAYASRPEIHEFNPVGNALTTGDLFNDWVNVFNMESALVYGPFSLQSELFYANTKGEAGQVDSDFYGAYLYASYFLTGENRVYKRTSGTFSRVKPFTNFFIVRTADGSVQSGWGAWEVAARWSYLELREGVVLEAATPQLAGKLNDVTLGVNWHLNPYTRVMFNYIHSWHDWAGPSDGQGNLLGNTNGETDIVAARLQFDF
jgi:phosphate-selective porin OprO and OprP